MPSLIPPDLSTPRQSPDDEWLVPFSPGFIIIFAKYKIRILTTAFSFYPHLAHFLSKVNHNDYYQILSDYLSLSFGSNIESFTSGSLKSFILLRQLVRADWLSR